LENLSNKKKKKAPTRGKRGRERGRGEYLRKKHNRRKERKKGKRNSTTRRVPGTRKMGRVGKIKLKKLTEKFGLWSGKNPQGKPPQGRDNNKKGESRKTKTEGKTKRLLVGGVKRGGTRMGCAK